MKKLLAEVRVLQNKKDEMLSKYGDRCTNSRGRTNSLVTNAFKSNQEKLISLIAKGVELYGEEFIIQLKLNA